MVTDAAAQYKKKRPWHLGETVHFHPSVAETGEHAGVEKYVLQGLTPAAPFIHENTRITAFGSCFAQHISNHLNKRSFIVLNKKEIRSYIVNFNNEMVHTFSIRQQFDWALRDRQFSQTLWHDKSGEEVIYDDDVKRRTRELFHSTDVFIFTLGLSEIWCDVQTDEVFWRSVPESEYDPQRHRFRLSTVEENVANLKAIYETVRALRPEAVVVFTLSPIPLNATFRDFACVPANSVSKAILRVAIDQMMQAYAGDGKLFYFPAYEIVRDIFRNPFDPDGRHVKAPVIHYIMCCFEKFFCRSQEPFPDDLLNVAFSAALSADRDQGELSDLTFDLSAAADNAHFIEYRVNHALTSGEPDKALALARRAATVNRSSAQMQYLLGLLLKSRGLLDEAVAAFARAAHNDGRLAKVRRELGAALMRLGRYAEAAPHLEAALIGGEDDFAVVHQAAGAMMAAGALDKAEALQRRACLMEPASEDARRQLQAILATRERSGK
jgi:tetratricopeptide (TPR) repeat protein